MVTKYHLCSDSVCPPIQSCILIWSQNTVLKIKKDAVIIQIKTRKKDIKSKQDSSIITLFLWEKRDKKKPKSYIYTYYSKSKPYRSAKKNLSNKSKKWGCPQLPALLRSLKNKMHIKVLPKFICCCCFAEWIWLCWANVTEM